MNIVLPDPMDLHIEDVRRYMEAESFANTPELSGKTFHVAPLAKGEYHLNYTLTHKKAVHVFRMNMGSQMGLEDQITYEFHALKLLEDSGRTPRPLFFDDSKSRLPQGVGIMEFLPADDRFDYRTDTEEAARLFAKIHEVKPNAEIDLVKEEAAATLLVDECLPMLDVYLEAKIADPNLASYLSEIRCWMLENKGISDTYFAQNPIPAILNTEVNATNFIVNRKKRTLHLVDWEMAKYGDPSQDLSHFCSPLTTMWKKPVRLTDREKAAFIRTYAGTTENPLLAASIEERVRFRDPFVYLRGLSWSAMAWVRYQDPEWKGVRNASTWNTLVRYMDFSLIRELFDPYLSMGDLR